MIELPATPSRPAVCALCDGPPALVSSCVARPGLLDRDAERDYLVLARDLGLIDEPIRPSCRVCSAEAEGFHHYGCASAWCVDHDVPRVACTCDRDALAAKQRAEAEAAHVGRLGRVWSWLVWRCPRRRPPFTYGQEIIR